MSLESFKSFVKDKPSLSNFVKNKEMTWQDFYNMYELYGERNSVWDKYLTKETTKVAAQTFSLKDLLASIKAIDLTEVQKTIGSLQKGIGYLQNMVRKDGTEEVKETKYEPRPIHKHFED